jgi:centrin-3
MNSLKKQNNSINNITNNKKFILSDEQINLLKEAFDLFDMEKTGKIDFHELKLTLKAFGFKITKEEMFIIKEKLDPQNTNKISFDNFIDLMTQKFSERNPREEAIMAFDLFDEDKKGQINIKNLKKAVKEINENLTDLELKAIIDEFDNDKDGFITKNDFLKIMDEYYFD